MRSKRSETMGGKATNLLTNEVKKGILTENND